MRSKMERVYVPHFCEICGKETFVGQAFGRDVERHVSARSGDRMMLCDGDRCASLAPKPLNLPTLSAFFTDPAFRVEVTE